VITYSPLFPFGNFFLAVDAQTMFNSAIILYALFNISNPLLPADDVFAANTLSLSDTNYSTVSLSRKSFSLNTRYNSEFVNGVFKDNILLTLKYLDGKVKNKSEINWNDIQKPRSYQFTLKPGESFAFHDQILLEVITKLSIKLN